MFVCSLVCFTLPSSASSSGGLMRDSLGICRVRGVVICDHQSQHTRKVIAYKHYDFHFVSNSKQRNVNGGIRHEFYLTSVVVLFCYKTKKDKINRQT